MSLEENERFYQGAKIKVIGVGGGGSNAVNTMISSQVEGVDFIAINTDTQSLEKSLASNNIVIGKSYHWQL